MKMLILLKEIGFFVFTNVIRTAGYQGNELFGLV